MPRFVAIQGSRRSADPHKGSHKGIHGIHIVKAVGIVFSSWFLTNHCHDPFIDNTSQTRSNDHSVPMLRYVGRSSYPQRAQRRYSQQYNPQEFKRYSAEN